MTTWQGKKSELPVSAEKNVLAPITDRLSCGRRDDLLEGQIKVSKLLFEKGNINFVVEVEIYNDSRIYKKGQCLCVNTSTRDF